MSIIIKVIFAIIIATVLYIVAGGIIGYCFFYTKTDPTGKIERPYLKYSWFAIIPLLGAWLSHGYAMWPRPEIDKIME